jgi:sulfatase maturation enzyme AslB (radical SAM superfamily)
MTTNGTLLNDEIIEILENLPNFTLSFTFLSREDVDNTQIIKKVIE